MGSDQSWSTNVELPSKTVQILVHLSSFLDIGQFKKMNSYFLCFFFFISILHVIWPKKMAQFSYPHYFPLSAVRLSNANRHILVPVTVLKSFLGTMTPGAQRTFFNMYTTRKLKQMHIDQPSHLVALAQRLHKCSLVHFDVL